MARPTETERELRSGRYKGVPVPQSLQPVDDPAHAERLRGFREGVDAALDTVQGSVDRTLESIRNNPGAHGRPTSAVPIDPRYCPKQSAHGSHYWEDHGMPVYCSGWSQ